MTTIYQELAQDASELLSELGQPVQYVRYAFTNDLVEGTVSRAAQLTQSLPTAVLPASGEGNVEQLDVAFIDGVDDGKVRTLAICSTVGASFRPEPKDYAYLGGIEHLVRGCTPINVDGQTDVVYLLSLVRP